MKIYLSASHSVGKTTLARYISKKYNLKMLSETARMILSEQELQLDNIRHDVDLIDKYQQDVFDRQLIEEQKYESFVSDRSALDILAYSAQHSRILPKLIALQEWNQYVKELRHQIVFFIRPSKATLKSDGVRETLTWDGVVAIDAQIKLLLQMFDVKYYQIDADSMQERTQIIDNILNLLK